MSGANLDTTASAATAVGQVDADGQVSAVGQVDAAALRAAVTASHAERHDQLLELSHFVHANPELGNQEFKSAAAVADLLRTAPGADVVVGVGSLPTAVRAQVGAGELCVTICSEYDALPDVGHACGHNIIASAGVGAFLALAPHVADLGITLRLLGTPAEETTGGKITLLEEGAFDGTHVAMMIHPGDKDSVGMRPFAAAGYTVTYSGQSAHASAMPWDGINALDAMTVALTAIGLNRQQLLPFQQMHGAVISAGVAPNVIPDTAVAEFMVRADSVESLEQVDSVLKRCLEAGALASGAQLRIEEIGKPYLSMLADDDLEALFGSHSEAMGRPMPPAGEPAGSTDMGNVSQVYPSIHPMIGLGDGCPPIHSPEFAAFAAGPAGDTAVLESSLAMALTAVDCALDPARRARLLERTRA